MRRLVCAFAAGDLSPRREESSWKPLLTGISATSRLPKAEFHSHSKGRIVDVWNAPTPCFDMPPMITGAGRVRIDGEPVSVEFTVPKGPCGPEALLPGAQKLANQVADLAAARANRNGYKISCAKGCGACCRQMVPISPTEAHHLARLVDSMPPERAAEIRQRFNAALSKIEAAGLPPRGHPVNDKTAYREFGLAYFRQGVPCPFLREESCSIHVDRPLVCREYQVVSPPAACAQVGSTGVQQVPVPVPVWSVFARSVSPQHTVEWMPLIEALRYAEAHPETDQSQTGPQRVNSFLEALKR